MSDLNNPCLECEVVAGRKVPAGGLVLETPLFVAHAVISASPLRGWLVLAPRRHARWWWELTAEESAELGPLAARLFQAQRSELGAVHGYALALGDALHHMHLHLVPRYADTPKKHWGRAAFDAAPEDGLPETEIVRAAQRLTLGLRGTARP